MEEYKTENTITDLMDQYGYHIGKYYNPHTKDTMYLLEVPGPEGPAPSPMRVPDQTVNKLLAVGYLTHDNFHDSLARFKDGRIPKVPQTRTQQDLLHTLAILRSLVICTNKLRGELASNADWSRYDALFELADQQHRIVFGSSILLTEQHQDLEASK